MMNHKEKTKLLQSKNFKKFGLDFHPQVSLVSAFLVILFMVYAIGFPEHASSLFSKFKGSVTKNFNWFFILSANLFLFIPIYLFFSKLGEVRIGGPEAKPEFSRFSWYSMLISAGMGIGLMFWSVGEPMYHTQGKLPMLEGTSSASSAMAVTFFHWGFHPWGIYALISLALAFFAYNRGLPLSLRSVFYPIFKDRVFGWIGDLIDILAVISCLFGLATSLGFGAQQINAGLTHLFGLPQSATVQVVVILIITLIATLSVVSGIGKGVKFLSELNIRVALVFMLLIFACGPTIYILRLYSNSVAEYLQNFITISFWVEGDSGSWQGSWTVFYWAWWISWSPFVGLFIARISKGRTVREFVAAILLIPSILSFIWMTVFGGTAISQSLSDGGTLLESVKSNVATALYTMIDGLDFSFAAGTWQVLFSLIGTFLVISFFVTSSDSGSLVVDNLTSGGKIDSPVFQRVFWAVMEGLIAIALLIAGGKDALNALQTAVVLSGLPFSLILLMMIYSLHKGLTKDFAFLKRYREDKLANKIFNEKIHGEFENVEAIKARLN